ncbi:Reverse transcriptase domain - like 10 [Theobroma cacao]|nr:Reverse transcriptase domain - like 10 [Theobroma cacao]
MKIAEGDQEKTAKMICYNSFEFLVMPFILTNAPATFCKLINKVLSSFLDKFMVVYLDDIIVYSRTMTEHVGHLRVVFERLRQHQLYVKGEKCSFAQLEIPFLGHIIVEGRIRMDMAKEESFPVKARKSYPTNSDRDT